MKNHRVLLAEDHTMFRQGIKKILEEAEDLKVVGEVSDGLELLEFLKNHPADILILDISMPGMRGIEAAYEAKKIRPNLKILILTMHKNTEYLYHSMNAGAEGYLIKEDSDTELLAAIRKVLRGERYVSRNLSLELTDDFLQRDRGEFRRPIDRLSIREREVLKLLAEGNSSKEIADLLFISSRTAEHHRANIKKKLDLRSTADLVKYAIKKGYASLDSI
ncbi:MAG: response regulator transcription factor [Desulfobacterales bacterium]|nr:response regulator transcription factor [Desulfobacterales bacterium]MBL7174118.1 response regulator transcription factor [Desulfobacteraceae bacterium]MBU0732921.1 response regulator transcription factor [Pseudomonadota bacterium]